MLSLNHVRKFCSGDISKPSTKCRYLEHDDLDTSKHHCLKLVPSKKCVIDKEVAEFSQKMRRLLPFLPIGAENTAPLGDNCPGYIKLRSVPQGFDVK